MKLRILNLFTIHYLHLIQAVWSYCFVDLPISQLTPVHPESHMQVYWFMSSTHCPFTHGELVHSLISTKKTNQNDRDIITLLKIYGYVVWLNWGYLICSKCTICISFKLFGPVVLLTYRYHNWLLSIQDHTCKYTDWFHLRTAHSHMENWYIHLCLKTCNKIRMTLLQPNNVLRHFI